MRACDLLSGNAAQSQLRSQIIRDPFSFTYFVYFTQKLHNFLNLSVQTMSAPIYPFIVAFVLLFTGNILRGDFCERSSQKAREPWH